MLIALMITASLAVVERTPVFAAPTSNLLLKVVSARSVGTGPGYVHKGDAIPKYKFIINKDDTGNPHDSVKNCLPPTNNKPGDTGYDPAFPANCQWPSVRSTPGPVPIVTQGDQSVLNTTTALPNLPAGKYLISVTADGHAIDGAHFTMPLQTGANTVTVEMQPFPIPLSTIRIRVFDDRIPVDGTYEAGAEVGLAGFQAHLADVSGEVSTDYYGNPLCTTYVHVGITLADPLGDIQFDGKGKPVIDPASIGRCLSDAKGDIYIPNMGPNRYAATVVPPAGQEWIQTTTLEGGHDWDVWVQAGATGFDTELTVGGEAVPFVDFGFVKPQAVPAGGTGTIKGNAVEVRAYWPPSGGLPVPTGGFAGTKVAGPVDRPWVALSDLNDGDQSKFVGRGNPDGSFNIANVPAGSYQVTIWDGPQDMLLDFFNANVAAGQVTDVGTNSLVDWFTNISGTVFIDANGNGKRDAGEPGVPKVDVALKSRDNSLVDQGTQIATTDSQGRYLQREAYPLGKWVIQEVFNTRYQTTGITYQADNQPTETTILTAAVDFNVMQTIGLSGRIDWGIKPYDPGTNGGIVGTVTYDTTRNELDPKYAAAEDYQPSIPGLDVHLFAVARDVAGNPIVNPDGSLQKGPELNDVYTSETWTQPSGCTARDVNGNPLQGSLALPANNDPTRTCVESPMQGFQVGNENTVNGNYGFADSLLNLYPPGDPGNPTGTMALYAPLPVGVTQPLVADDYIVSVDIPNDTYGRPLYKVTKEEDINVFSGDGFLAQENFPPPPNFDPPNPPVATPGTGGGVTGGAALRSPCAGANHVVDTSNNPDLINVGGSPFQGQQRPLCDAKLVTLSNGQSVAPTFNLFTPVPLPTHFWGLAINDLTLSHDPRSILFGENAGIPNIPVGLYDYSGRLVDTVDTDFNGFYEALEPSTSTYNCPLPAGPCPGMYRFVANDPGQPGHINPNYSPRYRTISAEFQAWPGLYTPTDEAPTQIGVLSISPGSSQPTPVNCGLSATSPQLFSVSRPVVRQLDLLNLLNPALRTVTIKGLGFGATRGTGGVTFDGSNIATSNISTWNDTTITFRVPIGTSAGAKVLAVRAGNGQTTVNGLTLHVTGGIGGGAYNPRLLQVNPPAGLNPAPAAGTTFTTIQAALERAARSVTNTVTPNPPNTLVVVWPGTAGANNPLGSYYENIIMHSPVKLQGVGPGGVYANGTNVPGSSISGLGWSADTDAGTAWYNLLGSLTWVGNQNIPDSQVITVLSPANDTFGTAFRAAIDGFTVSGGDQKGFGGNLNLDLPPGPVNKVVGPPGAASTQGGGIFVNSYAHGMLINDNVIQNNSGSYGGAVRVGTPYSGDQHNDGMKLQRNRIRDNGGTNLAGGVALFQGTNTYEINNNDLCGNFSAEYGGAISHFGLSPGGDIHDNRIYFNQSYDEGGGIMIAGELPATPNALSTGSGAVRIHENLVQANLSNDDGGGIRLLQAGNFPIDIFNNMLTNNVSTHEGGAIALDDAPNVRFYNNTVMKNITTATAITSNGLPAPAGLSTGANSNQLQVTLPAGSSLFSNPIQFNNIFWDNKAGTWNPATGLTGIGATGDATPVNYWDMGVFDIPGLLSPTNSILRNNTGVTPSGTNKLLDPRVRIPYETSVAALEFRTYPSFVQAVIIANNVPPELMGDYHLQAGTVSPARNSGAASKSGISRPGIDFDHQSRSNPVEIGADEQ